MMKQQSAQVQLMKVAVLSDIQGNLPAMEVAVEHILDWSPDMVVMAGDLVNRGPSSRACLELFEPLRREKGWLPLQGNHEVWVAHCGRERPKNAVDADMRRFADWTYRQVAPVEASLLGWPDHLSFHGETEDSWVHVTHGSMAGNRRGVSASISDEELRRRLPEDIALFVGAHTHKAFERQLGNTQILNVGSVGSPFDGDVRASYGRLELRGGRWRTRIERLDYDRGRAKRDFLESGFMEEGGPLARIILQEWIHARNLMPSWNDTYQKAVRDGEIALERAVSDFLGSNGDL